MKKPSTNFRRFIPRFNKQGNISFGFLWQKIRSSRPVQISLGIVLCMSIAALFIGKPVVRFITKPRPMRLIGATRASQAIYAAKNKDISVLIGEKTSNAPKITVQTSFADLVSFTLTDTRADLGKPVKHGNKIIFEDVRAATDIVYTTLPNGIKEEIIVKQPQIGNSFTFTMETLGATPKEYTQGYYSPVFYDSKGNYLYHMTKPFAVDAGGIRTDNVILQLQKGDEEKLTARIIVDPNWLSSPERVYPVTIDPTVVHDSTSEYAAGQMNRVKDTGSGSSPSLESSYQELSTDQYTAGLWHMNEASENTCTGGVNDVCDASGNALDFYSIGSSIITSGQILGAGARSFNGSSNYLGLAGTSKLDVQQLTIEAWVYSANFNQNGFVFEKTTNGNVNTQYSCFFNNSTNGEIYFRTFNTTPALDDLYVTLINSGIINNAWNHLACVYNGFTKKIYVNGKEVASKTYAQVLQTNSAGTSSIGTYGGGGAYFNGRIDEVRVSNIGRTPEEIKAAAQRRPYAVYTSDVIDLLQVQTWNPLTWTELGVATGDGETLKDATSLVAQWNFNDTSGATATNNAGSCGTDCNGTLAGFTSGSYGSQDASTTEGWTAANKRWGAGALMFDGLNDTVDLPNLARSSLSGGVSVAAWIKANAPGTTNNAKVIYSSGGTSAKNGLNLSVQSNGTVGFGSNQTSTTAFTVSSKSVVSDGQWHYVVGTWTGTTAANGANLYVDGKLENSATAAIAGNYSEDIGPCIGNYPDVITPLYDVCTYAGADARFTGVIDSVTKFTRALTASEIVSNYQAANIELQTRVGNTTDPNDGTWEAWKPTTNETQIDSMDSADKTWNIDYSQSSDSLISKKPTTAVNTGNGADGACTVTGTTNINTQSCAGRATADGVNFSSTALTSAGATSITLSSTPTGLTAGDEVMIINQQGTATNNKSVGQYEIHTIASISDNTLNFTDYALKNTYDGATQKITVQRMPRYTNVTIGKAASGKSGVDADNAGYSCLDLKNSGVNSDGAYWIDPDGAGGNAAVQAYCDMTRDGGGWTMAVKTWFQAGAMGQTGALGAISDATTLKGNAYKLSDTTVRDVIGPGQNFDILADQNGYNSGYSSGNYEYVVLRNYTGYWRFDIAMGDSTSETLFQSYRASDNALAATFNLQCGWGGAAGINCYGFLSGINPQGGAGCSINMGSSSGSGWHNFFMSEYNSDTYLYICNGAQYSSNYNLNHRFWIREKHPAVLTASAWNGTKGGLVAFRANGTVTINNGVITTAGLGYSGGSALGASWSTTRAYSGESFGGPSAVSTSTAANFGGGAGSILASGGPGGSHGSLGTNGVANYSGHDQYKGLIGIMSGQATLTDRMLMGSGGGGGGDGYNGSVWGQTNALNGRGGNGGGIIYITANTLTVNSTGKITANGTSGAVGAVTSIAGGSGGGGAGGSLALFGNTLSISNKLVSAEGGKTGSPYYGPYGAAYGNYTNNPVGGVGGVGRIAILYSTSLSGNSAPAASINKPLAKTKVEGTDALQIQTGVSETGGTVGYWHFGQDTSTKTFAYTGADQTYTVPEGVTSVNVKMWGGGGGGGTPGGWTYGYPGGGGGYTTGTLAVTPGQVLTVMVGAGGFPGNVSVKTTAYGGGGQNCAAAGTDCQYAGQGGGRSAIRMSNTDIMTAGGGGGGGTHYSTVYNMSGGGGGGSTGQAGWADDVPQAYGGGGTQSAGGAGATTASTGSAGTQYTGGSPNSHSYGGGGGGGWYGGGGGGYTSWTMGGGGGGSGYIGGSGVSAATTTTATHRIQANSADPDNGGAGTGGLPSTYAAPGKVIIIPNTTATALPYQETDASGLNNHITPVGTTLTDGVVGKARNFNGTSDYMVVPVSSNLNFGTNNFTIEFWFYDNGSANGSAIVSNGFPNYIYEANLIYFANNTLYYYSSSTAGSWNVVSGLVLGSVPVNKWTHFALIRYGSAFATYKDGVVQNTVTSSVGSYTNPNAFYIGRRVDTAATSYIKGKLDELKISNVARSAEEIAENYRMGRNFAMTKTISSTDLSAKNALQFSVAADRIGSYVSATLGESAFANYQPDANTVGLWHLEEKDGWGSYIKDSSSIGNHGVDYGIAPTRGKIGDAGNFNGSSDYVSLNTPTVPNAITIDAWVNFTSLSGYQAIWSSMSADTANTTTLRWNGTTSIEYATWYSYPTNVLSCGSSGFTPIVGQWYHIAVTQSSPTAIPTVYANGIAVSSCSTGSGTVQRSTQSAAIGRSGGYAGHYFNGRIDEVRISNTVRSAEEIRQAYEVGARTHNITIDFAAKLDAGNLIADTNDTSFTIDATSYGLTNKGSNLYLGDKIIIREYTNSTEYIAQGTVNAVTPATGAVSVISWDSGSTAPSGGFTVQSDVFKWQQEQMALGGSLSTHRNAITNLIFQLTNGNEGRSVWIDNIQSAGDYLTAPTGSTITSSTGNQYFQYRTFLRSWDQAVTATMAATTVDFTSNRPNPPTIGSPAAQSATTVRWNFTDTASNETGFKVYNTTNTLVATCATTDLTYCDETGLTPNTQYTRKIVAYNANGNSMYSATATAYTLAAVPAVPAVSSRAATTVAVNPDPATNPAATTMAIYKETGTTCDGSGGSYIAANGSDSGSTAVWQTDAAWATVTVTGLSAEAVYTFCVKAKNAENTETAWSTAWQDNSGYTPVSGDFVVTSNTSFINKYIDGSDTGRYVAGTDSGSGTTNTSVMEIRSGILTVNANETVVAGSFSITGGSIAIATGGQLKPGAPLWGVDQDSDGYTSNARLWYGDQPTNGRRKNLMTTLATSDCDDTNAAQNIQCCQLLTWYPDADGDNYGVSGTTTQSCTQPAGYAANNTDCNDTGSNSVYVFASATCYVDSDNDDYGSSTGKSCTNNATCTSATWASGGAGTAAASGYFAANTSDCYDANANARPGSGYCSATNRGDGSYDYNCSGSASYCSTTYYNYGTSSTSPYSATCTDDWRGFTTDCNDQGAQTVYTLTSQASCGGYGVYCTYQPAWYTCNNGSAPYCANYYTTGCLGVAAGNQACQ